MYTTRSWPFGSSHAGRSFLISDHWAMTDGTGPMRRVQQSHSFAVVVRGAAALFSDILRTPECLCRSEQTYQGCARTRLGSPPFATDPGRDVYDRGARGTG